MENDRLCILGIYVGNNWIVNGTMATHKFIEVLAASDQNLKRRAPGTAGFRAGTLNPTPYTLNLNPKP